MAYDKCRAYLRSPRKISDSASPNQSVFLLLSPARAHSHAQQQPPEQHLMHGKTVVITGATSGIGELAARRLAAMGARIVLIARNKSRGEVAIARLRAIAPGIAHKVHYADLSKISGMRRVAAEVASEEQRIDVLINNAGAIFANRRLTEDGLEYTFALNHMAYFAVTEGLRARLTAAAPSRIVNTASAAHYGARLDFADLQSSKHYSALDAYGRSKLCNVLFTRELARRLEGTGVTANCLHPGFVATSFGDEAGGFISRFVWIAKRFAISPEKGAETLVYLASSPRVAGIAGAYFYRCRPIRPSDAARDDTAALLLWKCSAELAGRRD
jgi:NAD(P)-dependent dehydrogenase (short-subunit alcohol dehydrogenase family)